MRLAVFIMSLTMIVTFNESEAREVVISSKIHQAKSEKLHVLAYKEIKSLDNLSRRKYLKTFEKILGRIEIEKNGLARKKKRSTYSIFNLLIKNAAAAKVRTHSPCLNKGILFEPLDGQGCTDNDIRTEGIYQKLNSLCEPGQTHCSILLGVGNCTSKNSTRSCLANSNRNKDVVLQAFDQCDVNSQGIARSPESIALTIPDSSYNISCNDFVNEINAQVRLADSYLAKGGRSATSRRWVRNIVSPFRNQARTTIASTCEYAGKYKINIRTPDTNSSSCDQLYNLASRQLELREEWKSRIAASNPSETVGAPSGTILVSGQFSLGTDYKGMWESILRNMQSCSRDGRNCNALNRELNRQTRLNRDYYSRRRSAERARMRYIEEHQTTKGAPSDTVSVPVGMIQYTYLSMPGAELGDFTEIKSIARVCVGERSGRVKTTTASTSTSSLCLAQIENCNVGSATVEGWFTCPQVRGACPSQPRDCIADKTIAVQPDRDSAIREVSRAARNRRVQN